MGNLREKYTNEEWDKLMEASDRRTGRSQIPEVECNDCGFSGKESELINKTGKHSKDDILFCPKCDNRSIKFK